MFSQMWQHRVVLLLVIVMFLRLESRKFLPRNPSWLEAASVLVMQSAVVSLLVYLLLRTKDKT